MRFENQTAVVAACGSDAGAACALNYLQQGAKVALYYDEDARLWPFDQISEEERSRLLTIQISDFRDHEELKRAADQVKEKFGTCDIVVTAVTTVPSKPAYDMDEEEYDRVMKTITNGSLYTIQPLMPMMIEKNYGRIVLVSSIAGRTAIPGVAPVYAAANAALCGMARNIGCTMGVHFITGNAVAVTALEDGSYRTGGTPEPQGILPGHELCQLNDVAGAVEYLTAPLASWTTGETLDLNGGYFMV